MPVPHSPLCSRARKRGGTGLNMLGDRIWEADALAVITATVISVALACKHTNYAFIPLVIDVSRLFLHLALCD